MDTNFTQVTLAALPLFATGVKMAKANDVTISNTGTQLSGKLNLQIRHQEVRKHELLVCHSNTNK